MDLSEIFVDNEDDVVITGIAGRFPESDTLDELRNNLFANKDLITEDDRRWPPGLYGLPTRSGKLKSLAKFDAQFFGISGKEVDYMDPQGRILLEVTYEAIIDSGWNPIEFRGTNTAVFVGASLTEAEESLASDPNKVSGYGTTGTKRNMLSNRVSFTFDLKGPSLSVDSGCSSSLVALQMAFSGIRSNQFDMAIVGTVNINLRPNTSLELDRLSMLSPDGKCKYLDASADGYVRSEAVSVVILQRRKTARRIYATVIGAKTNSDGHKIEGIAYSSCQSQIDLMEALLKESAVNPLWIRYVEADGTGTPAGDLNESNAIYKVLCRDRSNPLSVGSVKSNLGHSESASGLCSVAKMLIAFESRRIPASLHLQSPNPAIIPLNEGSILPLNENQDFGDSVVAINSFGIFGGTNAQILLRPHQTLTIEDPVEQEFHFEIPRLIVINGRTEDSVKHIFEFIVANPDKISEDFLALLNDVTTGYDSIGMDFRGFMVRDVRDKAFAEYQRKVSKVVTKRHVWFIISGMGTQWTGMAKGLMDIDVFNKSIQSSAQILEPYGIDLLNLILSDKEELLAPLLNSSVGVTAVQIALIDLLRALDIRPDGFIGHSSGELGCAYVDEVLDAREMLLFAYWRGKCVEMAKLPKGLMAAVGMSWEDISKRCPQGVVPACHNAIDSVTISGGYEEMDKFVEQLKSEKIFTKRINSSDIPFHSPLMKVVAQDMTKKLKSINGSQKLRSSRWISTSVPESQWSEPEGRYSSAEYFVNNLTSPVLFQEAIELIPKDAIVIEISPDSMFKNVIRRSVGPDSTYVGLMKRKNSDNNAIHLLSSIGELYNLGLKPKVEILYPRIQYPVRRGTQSLGSLIRWDHQDDWLVPLYPEYFNENFKSDIKIEIDLRKEENFFYFDHNTDGRVIFPTTGYLYVVWDEFARQVSTPREQLGVFFENVDILRAVFVTKNSCLEFKLNISRLNGDFQLYESDVLTVTGRVRRSEETDTFLPLRQKLIRQTPGLSENNFRMSKEEFYKELSIRGYHYGSHFKSVVAVDYDKNRAKVKYNNNWITFSDALVHFSLLKIISRDLLLPTHIQAIHCDPRLMAKSFAENQTQEVLSSLKGNYVLSNGLEMYGFRYAKAIRRPSEQELLLERYVWLPYMDSNAFNDDKKLLVESYIKFIESLSENKPKEEIEHLLSGVHYLLILNEMSDKCLVLKDIVENINSIPDLFTTDGRRLSTDLLNNLYFDESLIRPAIDVVLENTSLSSNQDFNVLEINLNQENCYKYVINYLKDSFHNLNVKYSLYNPIDTEVNINSTQNTFEKVDLNFSMSTKIANVNPLNLVIIREPFPLKNNQKYAENDITNEDVLKFIYSYLEINGFLLVFRREELTTIEKNVLKRFGYKYDKSLESKQFISIAERIGLSLVSKRSYGNTSSVLLFRKIETERSAEDVIIRISHTDYDLWFDKLLNEMKVSTDMTPDSVQNQRLIWLVSDAEQITGIVGFVKCLRKEPGGHRIRCISDMMFENLVPSNTVSVRELIDNSLFDNNLVMNIYRNGELGSYRHLTLNRERLRKSGVRHAVLFPSLGANKMNVQWVESQHNSFYNIDNIVVDVHWTGLNPSDLKIGTNVSTVDPINAEFTGVKGLCSEFSGLDENGNRVFGIKTNRSLSTTVLFETKRDLIAVPDHWSLEEACSVPLAYGTALFALIIKAQLKSHNSILIHSGDGYVGRAAISVALSRDCQVYTTVPSDDAKKQLMEQFSDLDETKVINTSIDSFKEVIFDKTLGKGLDFVFDYTNDFPFDSNLFCLKHNGRYLLVNDYHGFGSKGSGLLSDKNITIDKINFEDLFSESYEQNDSSEESPNSSLRKAVLNLIDEGITEKVVKPFKSTVFDVDLVSNAFQYLSDTRYKEKVLVRIRSNNQIKRSDDEENKIEFLVNAVHNTQFRNNRTYIITGGLGGFGLELANWLVQRGARNLVLTSRSGFKYYFQEFSVERLRSQGAQVLISKSDAIEEEECENLLKEANRMAPVAGIFSLAMVLSDGLFKNQSKDSMEKVLQPKVMALRNLDLISREFCPYLEYFVAFSSVTSGRGNVGQTNYGYANSYMERLCEIRRSEGLPALAIQWGAVADVGSLAEKFDNKVSAGTVPQRIHSTLSLMNHFLRCNELVVSSLLRFEPKVIDEKDLKRDIQSVISNVLGIRDPSKVSQIAKLSELGMDSLMTQEIQQSMEKEFGVNLSVKQLTDIPFGQIIKLGKRLIP